MSLAVTESSIQLVTSLFVFVKTGFIVILIKSK